MGGVGRRYDARLLSPLEDVEAPPEQVVSFLRERLLPVQTPDYTEVRKLIADLDRPRFSTRAKATKQLESLVPVIIPELRQALKQTASGEARERLENLMKWLLDPVPPAEDLRTLRAIAVLEQIGM